MAFNVEPQVIARFNGLGGTVSTVVFVRCGFYDVEVTFPDGDTVRTVEYDQGHALKAGMFHAFGMVF